MQTQNDILTALNAFYSDAFNHLITYTGILIAFVGIIIPILAQVYHNRVVRIAKDEIKEEMKKELVLELDGMKKTLDVEMKKRSAEFEEKSEKNKQRLTKEIHRVKGYAALQQTNTALSNKDHLNAAISHFTALDFFAEAEDEDINIQRALNTFTKHCMGNLTKDMWDDPDLKAAYTEFLKTFEKKGLDSRYKDYLTAIKKAEKTPKQ